MPFVVLNTDRPNFWDIYRYLPNETRRYIPLFIGAYFAMHYHREYGIYPRQLGRHWLRTITRRIIALPSIVSPKSRGYRRT